jgi:hypothetical protein
MSVSDVLGRTAVSADERHHHVAAGLWPPVRTMNTTNLCLEQTTCLRFTLIRICHSYDSTVSKWTDDART